PGQDLALALVEIARVGRRLGHHDRLATALLHHAADAVVHVAREQLAARERGAYLVLRAHAVAILDEADRAPFPARPVHRVRGAGREPQPPRRLEEAGSELRHLRPQPRRHLVRLAQPQRPIAVVQRAVELAPALGAVVEMDVRSRARAGEAAVIDEIAEAEPRGVRLDRAPKLREGTRALDAFQPARAHSPPLETCETPSIYRIRSALRTATCYPNDGSSEAVSISSV